MLAAPSSSAITSVAGVVSPHMVISGVGGTWYPDRFISRVAVRDAVKATMSITLSEYNPLIDFFGWERASSAGKPYIGPSIRERSIAPHRSQRSCSRDASNQ